MSWLPFTDDTPTGEVLDVVWTRNHTGCPGACLRPVGLAVDKRGRVWFTADRSGEVWLITVLGGNGTNGTETGGGGGTGANETAETGTSGGGEAGGSGTGSGSEQESAAAAEKAGWGAVRVVGVAVWAFLAMV